MNQLAERAYSAGMAELAGNGFSMIGAVTYSRAHPSRWAGSGALARLTADDTLILIEPLGPWRLIRKPVVRIPLTAIVRADELPFGGFRFVVPDVPELDGTRFIGIVPGDDRLTTLGAELDRRGLAGETVGHASSWREALGNQAVGQRPGFIWRDRGGLAYLESALVFAIPTAVLYLTGFFSGPTWFVIPVFAVVAVLSVAFSLAGARLRRK